MNHPPPLPPNRHILLAYQPVALADYITCICDNFRFLIGSSTPFPVFCDMEAGGDYTILLNRGGEGDIIVVKTKFFCMSRISRSKLSNF
jgi:hypothetical protein